MTSSIVKHFIKVAAVSVACLGPAAFAPNAFAQNVSTMADARFHEGLAFVQAGQYEQARLAFEQAYAISKDPTTLFNLALAEMKTGHEVEALRHFREFKRDPKAKQSDIPQCDALIQRMEAQTCQIDLQTTPGAQILVDGKKWGEEAPTQDPIDVGEGVHTIRVQLGAQWASKDVNATKGQRITITLKVGVDEGPGHTTEPPPAVAEKSTAFPPPTGAIILGGIGLVGIGVGVGFGVDALGAKSSGQDAEKAHPCANPASAACADVNSQHDHATRSALISNIGFIGGGALVAGGIVWWLVAPRKVQETAQIVPVIDKGYAGLSVGKAF
ncbi:MAG: hypothetical protein ABI551_08530 [Polyangiaceae bacterium]